MPKPVTIPAPQEELDWRLLREGIARCIKAVAPTARVYDRWPLKFNIGKTAELLRSDTDAGKIHAWIIGINKAEPYNDRSGGENLLLWDLDVRIWGFMGYEYGIDSANPQNDLENECRKIAQVIQLNKIHLTMDISQCLKEVGYVQFEDIDTQGFGQDDIIVAQGMLEVKLKETL